MTYLTDEEAAKVRAVLKYYAGHETYGLRHEAKEAEEALAILSSKPTPRAMRSADSWALCWPREKSADNGWTFRQFIERIQNDAVASAVPTGWMPIETAPRDGRWVWVYIPAKCISKGKHNHWNKEIMLQAHWSSGPKDDSPHQAPARALQLKQERGGYWSNHHNGSRPLEGHPTHWQPLPAAPGTGGTK